ncbi:hypothetical protein [Mycetocola saprophilus]|uniref:hypothetical protein n=1 Tax=Mycetocola saprophilus TaxID=76636 RepID=UPI0012DDF190|nr:hypothetical protein [Mycetocola saprophilus]
MKLQVSVFRTIVASVSVALVLTGCASENGAKNDASSARPTASASSQDERAKPAAMTVEEACSRVKDTLRQTMDDFALVPNMIATQPEEAGKALDEIVTRMNEVNESITNEEVKAASAEYTAQFSTLASLVHANGADALNPDRPEVVKLREEQSAGVGKLGTLCPGS